VSRVALAVAVVLLFAACGERDQPDDQALHQDILNGRSGTEVTFDAMIVTEPAESGGHERFEVKDPPGDVHPWPAVHRPGAPRGRALHPRGHVERLSRPRLDRVRGKLLRVSSRWRRPITALRNLTAGDYGPLDRARHVVNNMRRRNWLGTGRTRGCCGNYGDPGC